MSMEITSKQVSGDVVREIEMIKRRLDLLEGQEVQVEDAGEMASRIGEQTFGSGNTINDNGALINANEAFIDWWLPLNLADDSVTDIRALAYDGSEYVYVGGGFARIGGVSADNIARYSLVTRNWEEYNGGVNGTVYAIKIYSGTVYIGGDFTDAGGVGNADRIAVASGSTWAALGTGANGRVLTIEADATYIYIGGEFTSAGGAANTTYVARFNRGTSTWSDMGGGLNNTVQHLFIYSGTVYAGGNFTNANKYFLKFAGGSWAAPRPLSSGGYIVLTSAQFDGKVAFALSDRVYVYDGSTKEIAGTFSGGGVSSIAYDADGILYVAGSFTDINGISNTAGIVAYDGAEWAALSNGGGVSGLDGVVYSILALDSGSIIAGGSFNFVGAIQCQSIALYCKPLSDAVDVIASLFELYAERTHIAHDTATFNGAVGIGGAAQSGYALSVTGDVYLTGQIAGGSISTGSIEDDGVFSFTPLQTSGILIAMRFANSTGTNVAEYIIALFNTSSGTILHILTGSSTDVTSGVLTGTTGTDGKFTVSAHTDGKLYFENRRGAARTWLIRVL